MASGTITLTKSGSGSLGGRITWESVSKGTEANASEVTAKIQVYKPNGYTTTGTWKGSLKVGGTSKSISVHKEIGSSWVTLATVTATVSHNADGSGECYIYGKINGPTETTVEGTSVSKTSTVALDTIPRQAVMTSATDFNDEENPVITYTNPLGAAVPSLQAGISLTQSSSNVIQYHDVEKTAGTDAIELTDSERNTLRAAVTEGNTRTVWIYLRTRIGETYYYSPMSKVLTIKNPNPTISPSVSDSNDKTYQLTQNRNTLVRYYSNAAVTIGASAVKQATLESQKVTCGNKSLTEDGTINAVESGTFVFTATDSRGNTISRMLSKTLIPYIKLTCNLENNIPDTNGAMKVRVSGNYYNGSFGANSNTLTVKYRYKTAGGSYSSWADMAVTLSGHAYSATANVTGLDYQTAYVFQTYAEDELATVYSPEKTVKATPVFDWGENDFKFNVPVYIKDEQVRTIKRCRVGNNTSSTETPWYKFASIDLNGASQERRISFKVTFSYSIHTKFGILNAAVATASATVAKLYQYLQFECDTGIDSSKFVMAYTGTYPNYKIELWVKVEPWEFCFFEVLSESTRTGYIDEWTLYDAYTTGGTTAPTSGYTQITATKPYLLNSYPVGSYYISANSTSPASLFGGTWHRIESRFLWAAPSTSTLGATAGEMTHTLTVNEMPSHTHDFIRQTGQAASGTARATANSAGTALTGVIGYTGGGQAHNNMPPYVNVAIWRREA